VNKTAFFIRFPEFEPADLEFSGMIDAALAEAELAVADSWGDKRPQVVGLEAAHRLAITPFGRNAKLSAVDGSSTYGKQLAKMRRAFACAFNRLG
jgi:hypothetical protein